MSVYVKFLRVPRLAAQPELSIAGLFPFIGNPVHVLGIPTSPGKLVEIADALIQSDALRRLARGLIIVNAGGLHWWGCQGHATVALTTGHFNLLVKRHIRWY